VSAIYNEFDAYPAQWLRNLVAAGHIAPGEIDGCSIKELTAADVAGPGQRHFFAGIGVWSHALRLAGWADDVSVWTGSCPCQPFSAAGRKGGFDDARHLWPDWFKLIEQCRPPIVLGEQVASPDGLAWLDTVQADMEGAGYAFAAFDLCAAGFGAPHIRQRLYFAAIRLADANHERRAGFDALLRADANRRDERDLSQASRSSEVGGLADSADERLDGWRSGEARDGRDASRLESERFRDACGLADHGGERRRQVSAHAGGGGEGGGEKGVDERSLHGGSLGTGSAPAAGPVNGFWSDAEWLPCRDGKWRPVRPGSFPLAHGAPARVGRLRAYGNAIVSQEAAAFARVVREFLEVIA